METVSQDVEENDEHSDGITNEDAGIEDDPEYRMTLTEWKNWRMTSEKINVFWDIDTFFSI